MRWIDAFEDEVDVAIGARLEEIGVSVRSAEQCALPWHIESRTQASQCDESGESRRD